jgi:hypothetical protein
LFSINNKRKKEAVMPDYDKKYGLAKATGTKLTPSIKATDTKDLGSAKATTSSTSNSSNMGYKKKSKKDMGY